MNFLDRLEAAFSDTATLDKFLSKNAPEVIDWFNTLPHNELSTLHDRFRRLVIGRLHTWRNLPDSDNNLSFLVMMLEMAEALTDTTSFHHIYERFKDAGIDIGSRLRASAMYLYTKFDSAKECIARFEGIYELLYEASIYEEDNDDKVLSSIVNFYLTSIETFGEENVVVPRRIKLLIQHKIRDDPRSFLNCQLIEDILGIDLTNPHEAQLRIHDILDVFLSREAPVLAFETGQLVEDGTPYCDILRLVKSDFEEIRNISVKKHTANPKGQDDFFSLNRGTKIIDGESQLFAYMTAFGPMHSAKLISAFEKIDFENVTGPISVVDWGCGQGTATMVLFDYLNKHGIKLDIHDVILIEPSDLALRRGGRHSLKFDDSVNLVTVNKKLDDVVSDDFVEFEGTYLHLFSNILDVDAVSLRPLVNLIKENFLGINYFICASPFIDTLKRNRLDVFMDSFRDKNFNFIYEANNKKWEWIDKWTRVIRVFTAEL